MSDAEATETTEETTETEAPEAEVVEDTVEEEAPAPVVVATAPRSGKALRRGDTGPEVAALQETLNAILDRPRVLVDGQFGASTERWCQKILAQLGYDDEVSAFDPAFFSQLV